jgi:hypothetical protein
MASRGKKLSFSPADVAKLRSNPYIARLIEDAKLRADMQHAFEASRRAYVRLTNGKPAHRALLEDKKLQNELRTAVESLREVSVALSEAPNRRIRRRRRFGRRLFLIVVTGGIALAASEKLRSKVLDTLFGAEEEFEYTPPPPPPAPAPPASPVSSA